MICHVVFHPIWCPLIGGWASEFHPSALERPPLSLSLARPFLPPFVPLRASSSALTPLSPAPVLLLLPANPKHRSRVASFPHPLGML
ncbi:hypothetical protein OPV22_005187 [Ensete ventricosum]|uniref:Uncharacterized protein n=1 Tax=Ensete ventricosum TaxID=4639 RepID=A0AAV8RNZ8_ENSVE|nr:hypothetical protein OPV22_005187 [Ensete ventricosum]